MTRTQFAKYVRDTFDHSWSEGNVATGGVLWVPEERAGWKASHFLVCYTGNEHIRTEADTTEFWRWCSDNLSKTPLCYMINELERQEWWGFNTEEDMVLFSLKWCK